MTTELPPPTVARAATDGSPAIAPTLPATGSPTPAVVPHIATSPRPWATVPRPTGDPPSTDVTDAPSIQSRRAHRYGEPVVPLFRAGLVLVGLLATLIAQCWLISAMWERRNLLVDLRDGVPIADDVVLAGDDQVVRIAFVLVAVSLVTAPAVMAWMFRAYKNVGAWRPIDYGVGWSIFGWLVPIMNLLRPAKIMVEITEGSTVEGRNGGLVWWWWLAWLVPLLGIQAIGLMGDDIDSLLLAETIHIGLIAIANVDALLLMVIVARATNDQRLRIARSAESVGELRTD